MEGEEHLEPVIGYLTSDTVLEAGGAFDARGAKEPRVDAEVAVEMGADARAARYGAALELVDVARPPHDFESIVAENIWHRGVAFGPLSPARPPASFEARVLVGSEVAEAATAAVDVDATVSIAEELLAAVGEELAAGERIIAGSILHVPVRAGSVVIVDLGPMGEVGIRIRR